MKPRAVIAPFLSSLLLAVSVLAVIPASASEGRQIPFESTQDFLTLPDDLYLGEVAGVATNSKKHVFVFTRTGSQTMVVGAARAFIHGGSRLLEFGADGKYIGEIGHEIYGFLFAHSVRVDAADNIWVVDEGANMIIKFAPDGRVLLTLGRKPESVAVPADNAIKGRGLGIPGDTFDGPTDVAWDKKGNIYVADGTRNARIVKFSPGGAYIKAWGGRGGGPGQFNNVHALAIDAAGNVYASDVGNARIQVFDGDGGFKYQILGAGVPTTICITPGVHQYLYSSYSSGTADLNHGEIYKLELDGRVVGQFGTAGRRLKEFSALHALDCRNNPTLLAGEVGSWRVQQLTLR